MTSKRPVRLRPPRHLSRDAAQVWRNTIAAKTEAHTLTPACLPAIERFACAAARWRLAEARIADAGPVVAAPRSHVPQLNPWLSVARAASAEAGRLERELGLLPARRANAAEAPRSLKADGTLRPASAWDAGDDEEDEDSDT